MLLDGLKSHKNIILLGGLSKHKIDRLIQIYRGFYLSSKKTFLIAILVLFKRRISIAMYTTTV
jgi:hypothetical protein